MPMDEERMLEQKPNQPNQIFGYPGDGTQIIRRHKMPDWDNEEMTAIEELGDGWMLVEFRNLPGKKIKVSMADCGLIPYFEDFWNQSNWCEYV